MSECDKAPDVHDRQAEAKYMDASVDRVNREGASSQAGLRSKV